MSSEFQEAVINYVESHKDPVGNNGNLPFRLLTQSIREEDLEGECIDLALTHLKSCSFPDPLLFAITQAAAKEVLAGELSSAVKQSDSPVLIYNAIEIAKSLLSSIHSLCQRWVEDIPAHVLSQPKAPRYSQYGIKNTRRKMEDRHSVFPNLNVLLGLNNSPTIQWYAVYDGHGGLDASNYASKQLHLNFTKQDDFLTNLPQSLKSTILKTDEDFCAKSKNERLRSGTTAVVAVIVDQTLHISWIGDSQALIVRDGLPVTIMNPHKPEREDEKQRIEELGGCVVWFGAWRVNGTLSVSRAIGDADHKPFISGEADTFSVPLDGSEDFLCLACDGFWDVFTGDDLVRLVREHLRAGNNYSTVAEHLCLKAKAEGSTDNITVVVVFLRDHINLGEDDEESANEKVQASSKDLSAEKSFNSNNNSNSGAEESNNTPSDVITPLQGQQLGLEQKQKIPHKLLINFMKQTQQKRFEQGVVLTQSHPHAKLPHSLRNRKLENSSTQHPSLNRRNTKESLLSLATIESITQLPQQKPKRDFERTSPTELPYINNRDSQRYPRRSSMAVPPSYAEARKPLGHRAPNMLARGRTRLPYRTSIVATCQRGNSRSPSPRRGYTRSLPEEIVVHENGGTKIAITNSLAPSLKPRQQKAQNRHVARYMKRERKRSRSAF